MAAQYDFVDDKGIDKGATWRKTVYYRTAVGAAINLTGYTARLVASLDGATRMLELTTANGGALIDGPSGAINLLVTAAASAALDAGSAMYELRITSGGGEVTPLLEGSILVKPELLP